MGSSVPTWLTAWAFDENTGQLGNSVDHHQVGTITQNSYSVLPHALAATRNNPVQLIVAIHQHSQVHPADRFYFNESTGQLTKINSIRTRIGSSKLSMTANGQYIAFVPTLPKRPIEIQECFSADCVLIQQIDHNSVPSLSFTPADAQFTHASELLAVADEAEDRLITFNHGASWTTHQVISSKQGLPMLSEPSLLAFSHADDWLLVATQSSILLFAKLQYQQLEESFSWKSRPAWWENYLSQLCHLDLMIVNKNLCPIATK